MILLRYYRYDEIIFYVLSIPIIFSFTLVDLYENFLSKHMKIYQLSMPYVLDLARGLAPKPKNFDARTYSKGLNL